MLRLVKPGEVGQGPRLRVDRWCECGHLGIFHSVIYGDCEKENCGCLKYRPTQFRPRIYR